MSESSDASLAIALVDRLVELTKEEPGLLSSELPMPSVDRQRVLRELLYLRVFSIDLGCNIAFSGGPRRNQVMHAFYDQLGSRMRHRPEAFHEATMRELEQRVQAYSASIMTVPQAQHLRTLAEAWARASGLDPNDETTVGNGVRLIGQLLMPTTEALKRVR